ncbi:hypothetical protein Dimus_000962 [Dionaea muscipula]
MSTSAVRRVKERGGVGGRIAAAKPFNTKPLTPLSDNKTSVLSSAKNSTGKENSAFRGISHKPSIRPMLRVEKHSAAVDAGGESRKRWSISSSVTRGRSSSPSDFTRILSDLRRRSDSRVQGLQAESQIEKDLGSSGRGRDGIKVLEKKRSWESNLKVGEKGINGLTGNRQARGLLRKCSGNETEASVDDCEQPITKARVFDQCNDKVVNLLSNSMGGGTGSIIPPDSTNAGSCVAAGKIAVSKVAVGEGCGDKLAAYLKCNGDPNPGKKDSMQLDTKKSSGKVTSDGRLMDVSAEKPVSGGERNGNKYPSRLHEKLAFLEGKVKRIASDIKRTKEMLDMNNPDASKVMISDIQEKISGIEKAMVHVKGVSGTSGNGISTTQLKVEESNRFKQGECNEMVSVKEMKNVELEAMLFPHHKLLRDGASMSGQHVPKSDAIHEPIDENPIALEFLDSVSKEHSRVIVGDAHAGLQGNEVQETEEAKNSAVSESSNMLKGNHIAELDLMTDERLEEFDDQENKSAMIVGEEILDDSIHQLKELGRKASTGGWFVAEGESALLAHDDGSCSFYDIVNLEEKAVYKPPSGISPNVWRDCWLIRAPSADGCSGKFVVAASAGNTIDAGFCSWDLYTKEVRGFHVEEKTTNTRVVLGPLSDNIMNRRNAALSTIMCSQNQQWWYRPCGPLIISTASCQRAIKVFDVRDGEQIMKWDVQKPVLAMDYSSPLQWRNRGKVVVAEAETISLWDVSSLNAQALSSVSDSGRKVSAIHINNTDAEVDRGVRQRVSSSEAEGHDGVFCTPDSVNVIDFRQPSGVGLKIPLLGVNGQSVYSRGDSIVVGCSSTRTVVGKKQVCSTVLRHLSLRKQKLVHTYVVPEANAHPHHTALTQVWGNSNLVMGACGLGLFVFDAFNAEGFATDYITLQKKKVREVIGPDDMYAPSFDYTSSQILLISRDRPAMLRVLH